MTLTPAGPAPVERNWLGLALDAALLPARLSLAATRTTLQVGRLAAPEGPLRRPGGYAELLLRVIGEGGYVEQLADLLLDEDGPMRLAALAGELTASDRPLGRMLARGGVLDRLLADDGPVARLIAAGGALDRLLAEGGPLDKLVTHEGVLDRLLAEGGPVDRLTTPGGLLEHVLAEGGLAERLLTDDGFVEKMLSEGGTLDQLVALGATLEEIQPRLEQLASLIPELSEAADTLGRAVGPLGDLAGRLPLARRRALSASS